MKKIIALFLVALMLVLPGFRISADTAADTDDVIGDGSVTEKLELGVKGACLMEASSGRILYSDNEAYSASPASVTKVMSLLLVAEALESGCFSLEDFVTVSAYAASMGGSQVFLEEGERLTVEELIKCMVIASANDATVAMAELVAGSEAEFVRRMNARAVELGLRNTAFQNTTGLDDTTTAHYSSPLDIAVMSRELIKHDIILKYSSLWQDSIREGEFTLTNTNRLVRYYDGCNGLKTGSTDKAGFCLSATAKRDGMQLIAVVMGAETRDKRNEAARTLLDYGFANYALAEYNERYLENADVLGGVVDNVPLNSSYYSVVVPRSEKAGIELIYNIPESVKAPLRVGDVVGSVEYYLNGNKLGESKITVKSDVDKIKLGEIYLRVLKRMVSGT